MTLLKSEALPKETFEDNGNGTVNVIVEEYFGTLDENNNFIISSSAVTTTYNKNKDQYYSEVLNRKQANERQAAVSTASVIQDEKILIELEKVDKGNFPKKPN